jgi:DNA-directed RNA polymerase subunit F
MDDGKEEIVLDLDQDTIDYLNERAVLEDKTVDEVVEDILRAAIIAWDR